MHMHTPASMCYLCYIVTVYTVEVTMTLLWSLCILYRYRKIIGPKLSHNMDNQQGRVLVFTGGSATDRIWDKQRFQILRFSNLKSQKFSKISKFQEIDLIIEQNLYLA